MAYSGAKGNGKKPKNKVMAMSVSRNPTFTQKVKGPNFRRPQLRRTGRSLPGQFRVERELDMAFARPVLTKRERNTERARERAGRGKKGGRRTRKSEWR